MGKIPELRCGRLVSGRLEERRWTVQVIVKRRLFGRKVARSGIDSPNKGRAGYLEIFRVHKDEHAPSKVPHEDQVWHVYAQAVGAIPAMQTQAAL